VAGGCDETAIATGPEPGGVEASQQAQSAGTATPPFNTEKGGSAGGSVPARLLTVVGLMCPWQAPCADPLEALASRGGCSTVVGVMWLDGPGGMVLLPGLWLLLSAPLIPGQP